jgi:hypothetical protein
MGANKFRDFECFGVDQSHGCGGERGVLVLVIELVMFFGLLPR